MTALDLPAEWQRMLLESLTAHAGELEVWAYGSRVAGTHHDGSDLDLVVRNPRDLAAPSKKLRQLRSALAESDLPIVVEVHDWALLPDSFRSEIEREHLSILPSTNAPNAV